MNLLYGQVKAILVKNNKPLLRNRKQILREIIPPLIVGFLLVGGKLLSNSVDYLIPIFLPSALNSVLRKFMIEFVHEKSEKYKETHKIMGLRQSSYIIGWLLDTYLKGFIIVAILFIFVAFSNSITLGFGECLGFYIVFTFAAIHFSYCLTTIFSDAKLAGEMGTLIIALSPLLYFIMFALKPASVIYYYILSIIPFTGIIFAFLSQDLLRYPFLDKINNNIILGILIADAFIYLFLFLYLDLVGYIYYL